MEKEHIKGKANELVGKAKEKFGELTDDTSLEAKGKAQQLKGKVQNSIGDAKDAAEKLKR
ncbi:uncharacterized protein YjbJ (UPF0337 family) [Litorimonas taeanensis]|uniref:Uncharacterized protein YjbJ (UPF0337 family) n=1 Tax=Litorimonas taeanensis TaxID=568099 RepID=A0A420WKF7_9PROT|nr:CsbD family protein [Litorimonas taeanensis]RKQ71474.1 uncharacterized protein YjbJ (UPF0337 family) [Litorimonas taeanensis]